MQSKLTLIISKNNENKSNTLVYFKYFLKNKKVIIFSNFKSILS